MTARMGRLILILILHVARVIAPAALFAQTPPRAGTVDATADASDQLGERPAAQDGAGRIPVRVVAAGRADSAVRMGLARQFVVGDAARSGFDRGILDGFTTV
jgi:hypothetical protein